MEINPKKSVELLFHFSKNRIVVDPFHINNVPIQSYKQHRLLGVILDENLSWKENTKAILKKANFALYSLRFLKSCHVPESFLCIYYKQSIRSVLEYCAPLWHYAISKKDCEELEKNQRRAIKIINHSSTNSIISLESRREQLCKRTFSTMKTNYPELLNDFKSYSVSRLPRKNLSFPDLTPTVARTPLSQDASEIIYLKKSR